MTDKEQDLIDEINRLIHGLIVESKTDGKRFVIDHMEKTKPAGHWIQCTGDNGKNLGRAANTLIVVKP